MIALPISFAHVEIFEKTFTGGLSCVNTRLGFDIGILLPNLTQRDYNKMNITESFKAFKRDDLKICYRLKLDGEEDYSDWRVIAKILKLNENNQYDFVMTKPMPIGSIKRKQPDWKEFNLLLETVTLDDKIGHLFIIDNKFDYENVDAKQLMYNEIYPPVLINQKSQMLMRDQYFNFLSYTLKRQRQNQNHSEQLKNNKQR